MSSKRQQITDALVVKLATILTANGYQTDVGASVFTWRRHPLTADEVPCLVVADIDLNRDYSGSSIGQVNNVLTLKVAGFASSSTTLADARKIEEDIVAAIGDWETAGGLANWVQVESSFMVMEQHEGVIGAVEVTISATYATDRNQC